MSLSRRRSMVPSQMIDHTCTSLDETMRWMRLMACSNLSHGRGQQCVELGGDTPGAADEIVNLFGFEGGGEHRIESGEESSKSSINRATSRSRPEQQRRIFRLRNRTVMCHIREARCSSETKRPEWRMNPSA